MSFTFRFILYFYAFMSQAIYLILLIFFERTFMSLPSHVLLYHAVTISYNNGFILRMFLLPAFIHFYSS